MWETETKSLLCSQNGVAARRRYAQSKLPFWPNVEECSTLKIKVLTRFGLSFSHYSKFRADKVLVGLVIQTNRIQRGKNMFNIFV